MRSVPAVCVQLTPSQLRRIKKRLDRKKKKDSFAKQSVVIREIVEAGLQALGEK
jgi:hypothetical protein